MSRTRRQVLGWLSASGIAALTPGYLNGQSDEGGPANIFEGVVLEPFVDPLVVSPVARQIGSTQAGSSHYRVALSEFRQKLHRDLPPTVVWGFNGCMPGPVIQAQCGETVTVDWVNQLPLRHRLTVDHSLDGAGTDVPEVRSTIHLHGGHVSAENDGYPEDWTTPGQQKRTVYPNRQPGATLWYHDHAMGITRLNAMMGLAGVYLLHDPAERDLKLPSGRYDVPVVLQDRTLDARGAMVYPVSDSAEAPSVPEFFGTHILANGRVSPYFEVEPTLYRLRFVNASNARTFQLALDPEQDFFQIGTDGGLLPAPVARGEMLLAPGERIDTLIDFRGREGRRINLVNYAPAPYPRGGGPVPGLAMQFRVGHTVTPGATDSGSIPSSLKPVPRLVDASAARTRTLKLIEVMPSNGQPHRVLLDGKRFMDPITEDPMNGSVEIWEFVNTTLDAHPIHLHAVHFQTLDRRSFDVRRYLRTSEVAWTQRAMRAPAEELGWKDTVICPPGQVTRIIVPFHAEPGRFVWHCHMLEHEDNEMMRPYMIRA